MVIDVRQGGVRCEFPPEMTVGELAEHAGWVGALRGGRRCGWRRSQGGLALLIERWPRSGNPLASGYGDKERNS